MEIDQLTDEEKYDALFLLNRWRRKTEEKEGRGFSGVVPRSIREAYYGGGKVRAVKHMKDTFHLTYHQAIGALEG